MPNVPTFQGQIPANFRSLTGAILADSDSIFRPLGEYLESLPGTSYTFTPNLPYELPLTNYSHPSLGPGGVVNNPRNDPPQAVRLAQMAAQADRLLYPFLPYMTSDPTDNQAIDNWLTANTSRAFQAGVPNNGNLNGYNWLNIETNSAPYIITTPIIRETLREYLATQPGIDVNEANRLIEGIMPLNSSNTGITRNGISSEYTGLWDAFFGNYDTTSPVNGTIYSGLPQNTSGISGVGRVDSSQLRNLTNALGVTEASKVPNLFQDQDFWSGISDVAGTGLGGLNFNFDFADNFDFGQLDFGDFGITDSTGSVWDDLWTGVKNVGGDIWDWLKNLDFGDIAGTIGNIVKSVFGNDNSWGNRILNGVTGGGGGTASADTLLQGILAAAGALTGGSKDKPPAVGSSDPSFDILAELFGNNSKFSNLTEGLQIMTPGNVGPINFGGALFQPTFAQTISDMLNKPTAASTAAGEIAAGKPGTNPYSQDFYDTINSMDALLPNAQNTLRQMLNTGMPVSIDPLIAQAQSIFSNEFMPNLFEKLPGGTLSSSYIPTLTARESGRISQELGGKAYDAAEAARGRQMQAVTSGLPAYNAVNAARSILPVTYSTDLLNLDQLIRNQSPGGQLLGAFTDLAGLKNNFLTRGAIPSSSSQVLDALAQVVPSLAQLRETT
jgi:hypothetical protein